MQNSNGATRFLISQWRKKVYRECKRIAGVFVHEINKDSYMIGLFKDGLAYKLDIANFPNIIESHTIIYKISALDGKEFDFPLHRMLNSISRGWIHFNLNLHESYKLQFFKVYDRVFHIAGIDGSRLYYHVKDDNKLLSDISCDISDGTEYKAVREAIASTRPISYRYNKSKYLYDPGNVLDSY